MKIDIYTQSGEKKGEMNLNETIFGQKINNDLIHQYLVYQQTNARSPIAHTKTKGEVRGGGRKPFRQKGTGNARQGSTRNPHMRGGGVTFGPRNTRNFRRMMPKRQRRCALFSLLSAKAKDNQIIALDTYKSEKICTKDFKTMIKKMPIERSALIILSKKDKNIEKSSKNIPAVKSILVNYLNPVDILKYEKLLFLEEAFLELENIFLRETKKEINDPLENETAKKG